MIGRARGTGGLLVVAGEGSGDALAAPVVGRLDVPTYGLGGKGLRTAGAELVMDLRGVAVMGLPAVARRAVSVVSAARHLLTLVRERRPTAALLVGFSEFNARLLPALRRRGIRTLWYAPPQVWAWRARRAPRIAEQCDRLALTLPFEWTIWRQAGATAEYVGHAALELARFAVDLPPGSPRLAILPGSRSQEVHRHLPPMLTAARRLGLPTTVLRAPALDADTRRWVEQTALRSGALVTDAPIAAALPGSAAALVSSGTATLECAVLGVPPVIVYRTDAVTYAVARRLVRVRHVGLPNLVLGRREFPELLQQDATPERMVDAVQLVLDTRPGLLAACAATRTTLAAGLDPSPPDERVAGMLTPWL